MNLGCFFFCFLLSFSFFKQPSLFQCGKFAVPSLLHNVLCNLFLSFHFVQFLFQFGFFLATFCLIWFFVCFFNYFLRLLYYFYLCCMAHTISSYYYCYYRLLLCLYRFDSERKGAKASYITHELKLVQLQKLLQSFMQT